MTYLLRVTALNVPRVTRVSGASLALLIGVVHVWILTRSAAPTYLDYLFVAAAIGSFLAAGGILAGLRRTGWGVGVTISALALAGYVISRSVGLPGFPEAAGAWHDPLGTATLALDGLLLALYGSLLVGWNVDSPGARDWDTYFSHSRQ